MKGIKINMKNSYILECSVDSVESALAAEAGGADRLELCSNLIIGGTTPTVALFEEIRKYTDIPIYVLIRPRFGDFLYTEYEANVICSEITAFEKAGAEGVVIGSLNKDGSLNMEQMKRFIACAKNMSVTLHRAFDMCTNPLFVLEQAKELGIDTILTSGQEASCIEGITLYRQLLESAKEDITILAGAGVTPTTIQTLLKETKLTAFHMSGKEIIESEMEYRNARVFMGLPGISEYSIWRTAKENVCAVRKILDEEKNNILNI